MPSALAISKLLRTRTPVTVTPSLSAMCTAQNGESLMVTSRMFKFVTPDISTI